MECSLQHTNMKSLCEICNSTLAVTRIWFHDHKNKEILRAEKFHPENFLPSIQFLKYLNPKNLTTIERACRFNPIRIKKAKIWLYNSISSHFLILYAAYNMHSWKLARQKLTRQRLTHFSVLSTIKMRQSLAKDCNSKSLYTKNANGIFEISRKLNFLLIWVPPWNFEPLILAILVVAEIFVLVMAFVLGDQWSGILWPETSGRRRPTWTWS